MIIDNGQSNKTKIPANETISGKPISKKKRKNIKVVIGIIVLKINLFSFGTNSPINKKI